MKVTNVCLFALLPLSVESVAAAQLRAHPRLFFTASELHALRAKAKDESKGEMGSHDHPLPFITAFPGIIPPRLHPSFHTAQVNHRFASLRQVDHVLPTYIGKA